MTIDPTTGRTIRSGPNGEGGTATYDEMLAYAQANGLGTNIQTYTAPGGSLAYYIPGALIQAGNRQALGLPADPTATSLAPGATAPTGPQPLSPTAASNAASIKSLLSSYGLDELVPQVDTWVRNGLSWPEIEVQLRDPTSAAGKVVDRLYPEIQLRAQAGKQPMSIQDIQSYRTDALKAMRAAGVPQGFYDSPSDMQNFIVNDVSIPELQARIGEYEQFGAQIAAGAGNELDLFQRAYGVTPTAVQLAALVLDPTKALPSLQREFSAVKMDVAAGRAGYGDLSGTEAEHLVDTGVTQQQAQQGFGQLAQGQQLYNALPGENVDAITRQQQLGATFDSNAQDQQLIQNRAERRKAAFGGGGGFAQDQSGFGGLGQAR